MFFKKLFFVFVVLFVVVGANAPSFCVRVPGTLTVTLCPDSPEGEVDSGRLNVLLASYCLTAEGEDVMVKDATLTEDGVDCLENGQLSISGQNVGDPATIINVGSEGTHFGFDDYEVVVTNGETLRLDVAANIICGTPLPQGEVFQLVLNNLEAVGITSQHTIETPAIILSNQFTVGAYPGGYAGYLEANLGDNGPQNVSIGNTVATNSLFFHETTGFEAVVLVQLTLQCASKGVACQEALSDVVLADELGAIVSTGVLDPTNGSILFSFDGGTVVVPAGGERELNVITTFSSDPQSIPSGSWLSIQSNQQIGGLIYLGVASSVLRYGGVDQSGPEGVFLYRSVPTVAVNQMTPRGSVVLGSGQDLALLDVTAEENGDVNLMSVPFLAQGTFNNSGTGALSLWRDNDLSAPVAVIDSKTLVFSDLDFQDDGDETTFEVRAGSGNCMGLPFHSVVRLYDASVGAYRSGVFLVEGIDTTTGDCEIILYRWGTWELPTDLDDGDRLEYRPLFAAKYEAIHFGSVAPIEELLESGSTTLAFDLIQSVLSPKIGDFISPMGYASDGSPTKREDGCEILKMQTWNNDMLVIEMTPCHLTAGKTLDPLYDSEPIYHHVGGPVALIQSLGQAIPESGTITYRLRGDTTGGTINETLQVVMYQRDILWNDDRAFSAEVLAAQDWLKFGLLVY